MSASSSFASGLPGIVIEARRAALAALLGGALTVMGLSIAAVAVLLALPDSPRVSDLVTSGAMKKISHLLLQGALALGLVAASSTWQLLIEIEQPHTFALRTTTTSLTLALLINGYAIWAFWNVVDIATSE
ncbi:MAG: hypothetical protein AAGA37_13725 [Actinomycetota bacterium]